MPKVIFEQFDGGLQKGWYEVSTSNRAFKNQKKNGIAYGCVNPFIQDGVLVPGIGSRTAATNESTVTGSTNRIRSIVAIADNTVDTTYGTSVYFGQDDDLHAMDSTGIIQTSNWPQTLAASGVHASQTDMRIDKIVDYQVNGARKQIAFFRSPSEEPLDSSKNSWDAAYYNGLLATSKVVTMTINSPGIVSSSTLGPILNSGDTIRFTTSGALPTGVTAGTTYYVKPTAGVPSQFQIAATKGGADINFTGSQSGTHTAWPGLQTIGMGAATGYSTLMCLNDRPILAAVSDNGYMYFGNGSLLHKFDGTTAGGTEGTITGSVLAFPTSREMVDIADGFGKIWILTRPKASKVLIGTTWPYYSSNLSQGPISVVVWNRISTSVSIEDNIVIDGCSNAMALWIHAGVVYCWTKTPADKNQLRAFNGKSFEVIAELGTGLVGSPAINNGGSICSYENGFIWQDWDGNAYFYGSINPGITQPSVYWISNNSGATGGTGGAIFGIEPILSPQIWTSYAASGVVKLRYFSPPTTSETGAGTVIYTSAIELPKLSTINGVTVFFNENPNADSSTTTMKVYNSWKKTSGGYLITKSIDHDVDIPRGWAYFPMSMENSNLVQISFSTASSVTLANSPQITRIEVDYTPTTKLK